MSKSTNSIKSGAINEKLRVLIENSMKQKFSNQIAFANYLGVTQATVSRYLSGSTAPSLATLKKICSVLGIDLAAVSNAHTDSVEPDILKLPFYNSEQAAGREISGIGTALKLPFYNSEHAAGRGLSGIGAASANRDSIILDKKWFQEEFSVNFIEQDAYFAFKVRSDSMETIISEDDLVIAKKSYLPYSHHGIYLVNYNDDYLIKKIQFKNKHLIKLISNNPDYDALDINLGQMDSVFNIIARVVGRISSKKFTSMD